MVHIKHGGMDMRATGAKAMEMPKAQKEIDHLRVAEAENGGHTVFHHHTNEMDHPPEGPHIFAAMPGSVAIPKGHVLEHIAKHMAIPHTVIEAKEEGKHAPDEQEELEAEEGEGGEMGDGVNA